MKQVLLIICTAIAVSLQAQTNYSLSLDGTGQHVTIPDNNALDINSAITIEMWVYLNTIGNNQEQELVDKANDEATNYRLLLYNSNGVNGNTQLGFWNTTNPAVNSTARISNQVWTHVAATISGGTLSLYVNGVLSNTAPLTVGPTNNAPLTLGKHTVMTTRNFNGRMENLRIWNVARTAAQIRAYMYFPPRPDWPNLVAFYRFNESSGTSVANAATATGTAINGSLPSGGSFVASPIQYSGNALAMDGADDHIPIGSPLPSGSSYTKEAWIYLTNPSVPNNVLSSYNAPLWIGPRLQAGNNRNSATVTDPVNFPASTWTHVAVSWDAGTNTFRLYKNGVQVAATNSTAIQYVAETNYIGAWFNSSSTESYLGGMIDDVRLWNTARTQTQIFNNMNAEVIPANEPNLVAYYTFDQGLASGTNAGINMVPDNKGNFNGTMNNFAMTGTTSNFVTQKTGFAILPVSWLSFTAAEYQQQVLLKWSTAAEENNASFTVQHSTDGETYSDLATLPSTGNGTQVQQYRYTHTNATPGVNYYRIKQTDHSGAYSFSAINTVRIAEKGTDFAVLNTVVQHGVLQVQVYRPISLQVVNSTGSVLYRKQLNKGNHTLDLSKVATGVALITSDNQVQKIIVQ